MSEKRTQKSGPRGQGSGDRGLKFPILIEADWQMQYVCGVNWVRIRSDCLQVQVEKVKYKNQGLFFALAPV